MNPSEYEHTIDYWEGSRWQVVIAGECGLIELIRLYYFPINLLCVEGWIIKYKHPNPPGKEKPTLTATVKQLSCQKFYTVCVYACECEGL